MKFHEEPKTLNCSLIPKESCERDKRLVPTPLTLPSPREKRIPITKVRKNATPKVEPSALSETPTGTQIWRTIPATRRERTFYEIWTCIHSSFMWKVSIQVCTRFQSKSRGLRKEQMQQQTQEKIRNCLLQIHNLRKGLSIQ